MGTVALVGMMNWRLLLPLIILVIITVKIRQTYLETARDVKRLEATSIFYHVSIIFTTYLIMVFIIRLEPKSCRILPLTCLTKYDRT